MQAMPAKAEHRKEMGIGKIKKSERSIPFRYGAPNRIRTCGLPLRRRSLYPTELRAHKNLLYFNASCPFCQRRSSANTTNARSFRTGRLWEEGDNTKGDRAPACRLAGMSGGLLYRGSDGNGGQRPPSGPRPRLSALDLSAASRRLSGKPCRPGRAGTEWNRTGSQITPRPCPAC